MVEERVVDEERTEDEGAAPEEEQEAGGSEAGLLEADEAESDEAEEEVQAESASEEEGSDDGAAEPVEAASEDVESESDVEPETDTENRDADEPVSEEEPVEAEGVEGEQADEPAEEPVEDRAWEEAVVAPGLISREQAYEALDAINTQYAHSPLDFGDVWLIPLVASSQGLDAYGMRMGESSIERYMVDALEGNPLMNSHRTGSRSFFSSTPGELAYGTSVNGWLDGEGLDESAILKVVSRDSDDDVVEYEQAREPLTDEDIGLKLNMISYMLRDHRPNGGAGPSTDDLARGLRGGVQRRWSITWDARRGGSLVCGLCGLDLRSMSCPHLPLIPDRDTGIEAFGWIRGARMLEHSVVYHNATPETLTEKAMQLAAQGELSPTQVDLLESVYQQSLTTRSVQTAPDISALMQGAVQEGVQTLTDSFASYQAHVDTELEQVVTATQLDEAVSGFDEQLGTLVDEQENVLASTTEFVEELVAVRDDTNSTVSEALTHMQAAVDGMQGQMAELVEKVDDGIIKHQDAVLESAIDELLRARTRAGMFFESPEDLDAWRQATRKLGLARIRAEVRQLEAVVRQQVHTGRPTQKVDRPAPRPPFEQRRVVPDDAIDVERRQDPELYRT